MSHCVFITGNSSGLGHALSENYLARGWRVYGLSRRGCRGLAGDLHDIHCDLANQSEIVPALTALLAGVQQLDVVYLNAGVLGELRRLGDITRQQLDRVMNINVWANKFMLDWLFARGIQIRQVIAISSGAALSANRGWGCYSLSKIALNKLLELYAGEFPGTHFISLAPGLVDTAMQDYLCDENSTLKDQFPGVKKFRDARGTDAMPPPRLAAKSITEIVPQLMKLPSGSYADIRNIK